MSRRVRDFETRDSFIVRLVFLFLIATCYLQGEDAEATQTEDPEVEAEAEEAEEPDAEGEPDVEANEASEQLQQIGDAAEAENPVEGVHDGEIVTAAEDTEDALEGRSIVRM